MLNQFKQIVQQHYPFLAESKLYLALSGGKDSMVLSHLLQANQLNHTLLHCNFKLRGKESDADELFVKQYAAQNKLPIFTTQFDTAQYAQKNNLTIQEAARELRYNWFSTHLQQPNAVLLTAHHFDDSIETFFINLMRGTALKGLTGIASNENKIVRPLLHFTSTDIKNYITTHTITYREDSSNSENKYLRNKLRNQIIPLLAENSNEFTTKMRQTMDTLNAADHWIETQVQQYKQNHFNQKSDHSIHVSIDNLTAQDAYFIQRLFKAYGISRKQNTALLQLIHATTGASLKTTTHTLYKNRNEIILLPHTANQPPQPITVKQLPATFRLNQSNYTLSVQQQALPFKADKYQQLSLDHIKLPLTFRTWKKGDKISPLGFKNQKKISDILINKKIPLYKKNTLIVCQDATKTIICIPQLMVSEKYKLTASTQKILCIAFN